MMLLCAGISMDDTRGSVSKFVWSCDSFTRLVLESLLLREEEIARETACTGRLLSVGITMDDGIDALSRSEALLLKEQGHGV